MRDGQRKLLSSLLGLLLWFFNVAKRKRKRLLSRLPVDLLPLLLFVQIVWPTTLWCENTPLWKALSGLSVSYLPLLESSRWYRLHHSYWKNSQRPFSNLKGFEVLTKQLNIFVDCFLSIKLKYYSWNLCKNAVQQKIFINLSLRLQWQYYCTTQSLTWVLLKQVGRVLVCSMPQEGHYIFF